MATSNFTFGASNPLNTKVDPFAPTTVKSTQNPVTAPYPTTSVADLNAANVAARAATEAWASPFSTAFGGTAPSTTLDYVRQYASPFSTVFGGSAPATPYSPSEMNAPVDTTVKKEDKGGGGPGPGDQNQKDKFNTSPTSAQLDSIAAIKALLSAYGLGDLTDAITNSVIKGYSSDTIQLIMQDPNSSDPLALAFQKRFPANKARAAAGKSVLSAAEYLAAERSYTQVLQSYGVSSMATREKLSSFITNDISAAEVSDRVGLAINRVQNADAETKKMLAEYYPMLNQADIVGAVLDPAEGLPALQRKIQISEIGGAALAQNLTTGIKAASDLKTGYTGLTTGALGAEELAALGVTKEQARAGYQTVAEVAPRGEFLSSISTGEDYTRLQAEQEAFQGLASAKRARVNLTQAELARFGGQSGTSKGAFSTGYLSRQGKSGAF